jgi:hypothetical protein
MVKYESSSHAMTRLAGRRRKWQAASLCALPVSLLVLGLFYYWFGIADRYFIFLYYHDMGPVVPDTAPFSPVTSSRYWMAGLVASGATLMFWTTANWLLGRLSADYHPPVWWRVWALSSLLLVVGILAITMNLNAPTLPLSNAQQVVLATLVGLGLALLPGEMAARRPGELFWLTLDGVGLMLILLTFAGLQNLTRWWTSGGSWWILMLLAALVAAAVWLLVVTGLRTLFRTPVPGVVQMFLAGLCVAYVLMPLVHHVLGTDGLFYITNSNNFFADNVTLQITIWLLVAGLIWLLTRLRQSLAIWRTAASAKAA